MPRILVADDNSNIQKMVSLAFEDHGIDVVAVGNGEAAVRRIPDLNPDLVLADIFMPVRNGYEVCEFVKKDPRFSKVPVILLVGAFDPLDENEARRVGADGVLKKPFVPPDPLIAMVTTALGRVAKPAPAPVPAPEPVIVPVAVTATKTAAPSAPVAEPEEDSREDPYAYGTGRGLLDAEDDLTSTKTKKSFGASEDDAETAHDWRRDARDFEVPESVSQAVFESAVAEAEDRHGVVTAASAAEEQASIEPPTIDVALEEKASPISIPEEPEVFKGPDASDKGNFVSASDSASPSEPAIIDVPYVPAPLESATLPEHLIEDEPPAIVEDVAPPEPEIAVEATPLVEPPAPPKESSVAPVPLPVAPPAEPLPPAEPAPVPHRSWLDLESSFQSAGWMEMMSPAPPVEHPLAWKSRTEEAAPAAAASNSSVHAPEPVAPPPVHEDAKTKAPEVEHEVQKKNREEVPVTGQSFFAEVAERTYPETTASFDADDLIPSDQTLTASRDAGESSFFAPSEAFRSTSRIEAAASSARHAEIEEPAIESIPATAHSRIDSRLEIDETPQVNVAEPIVDQAEELPVPVAHAEVAEVIEASEPPSEASMSAKSDVEEALAAHHVVADEEADTSAAELTQVPAAQVQTSSTLDSTSMDAVVNRVLERLEPQLHEILSNGVLRPLIEGVLKKELDKK